MIISLIGFMGTGKSSVGIELSRRINFLYCDTDTEIEQQAAQSITEIFDNAGESYFRQLEEEILKKIVNSGQDIVLSTGGGIVLSAKNRHLLQEKTIAILLQAEADEIYHRIKDDTQRPLLEVENPLLEIKELLTKRQKFYQQFSIKIKTDGLQIEEIVELIIKRLTLKPADYTSIEEVSCDDRTE